MRVRASAGEHSHNVLIVVHWLSHIALPHPLSPRPGGTLMATFIRVHTMGWPHIINFNPARVVVANTAQADIHFRVCTPPMCLAAPLARIRDLSRRRQQRRQRQTLARTTESRFAGASYMCYSCGYACFAGGRTKSSSTRIISYIGRAFHYGLLHCTCSGMGNNNENHAG